MNNKLAELIREDVTTQFKEQAEAIYERMKFDSKEMEENVASLVSLAKKLGRLIADFANHSETIEGADLANYVGDYMMVGVHERLDHEADYEKFIKGMEAEIDEDEDEDDDDESIPDLIDRVLKELRNL